MTDQNHSRCIKCRKTFDGDRCAACYPPPSVAPTVSHEPPPLWKQMLERLGVAPAPVSGGKP